MTQNRPSQAFQEYYNQLPSNGEPVPFNQMQRYQTIQRLTQVQNNFDANEYFEEQENNIASDKLQQYANFVPPEQESQQRSQPSQSVQQSGIWLPNQSTGKQPKIPKGPLTFVKFDHKNQRNGCLCDLVCNQPECRTMSKICCVECAPHIHPNHSLENIESFFNRHREKLKRKDGVHKTHLHEVQQILKHNRRKRRKYWKWFEKMIKKVEEESQLVENFQKYKLYFQMRQLDQEEKMKQFLQLLGQHTNNRIESIVASNLQWFGMKQEDVIEQDKKKAISKIKELGDELFKGEQQSNIVQHEQVFKQMQYYNSKWVEQLYRLMGANKKMSKKMLRLTRMSLEDESNIQCVEVKLAPQNKKDNYILPAVKETIVMNDQLLITVHADLIQLWQYNNKTFQQFKAVSAMQLSNLKKVVSAKERQEFMVLHDNSSIWCLKYQNKQLQMNRIYMNPIKSLVIYNILVTDCERMLFACGGNKQGFFIICWNYSTAKIIRIVRRKFQFFEQGYFLLNDFHLIISNKKCADIFLSISGEHIQTITLPKPKQTIEYVTIFKEFQNQNCVVISTNSQSFYVYAYENYRYHMIYEFDSDVEVRGAYMLFYQPDLAEDGFITVLYENQQTLIRYVDLNTKILFNLSLKDQCLCGRLNSQRSSWRHQLALILGFESGYLRIINILKND